MGETGIDGEGVGILHTLALKLGGMGRTAVCVPGGAGEEWREGEGVEICAKGAKGGGVGVYGCSDKLGLLEASPASEMTTELEGFKSEVAGLSSIPFDLR